MRLRAELTLQYPKMGYPGKYKLRAMFVYQLIFCVGLSATSMVKADVIDPISSARAPDGIQAALQDPDSNTRVAALNWLASHTQPTREAPITVAAHQELVRQTQGDAQRQAALLTSPDPTIRAKAISSLGGMGVVGETFAAQVASMLNDPEPEVRSSAVRALVMMKNSGAVYAPQVASLLKDTNSNVYENAVQALGKMGAAGALYAPQVADMLADSNPEIRSSALFALKDMGPAAASVAPKAVALLDKPDPQVRVDGLIELMYLGVAAASYAPQVVPMLTDTDPDVRSAAAAALGKMGSIQYAPQIIALLTDANQRVRANGAFALESFNYPDASLAPKIAALLTDAYPDVLDNEINILGAMRATSYASDIAPLLTNNNPMVRRAAVFALGSMKAIEFAPQVAERLKDPADEVRQNVGGSLKWMGATESVLIPTALAMSKDPNPDVRAAAAMALGYAGPTYAPQLAQMLNDSSHHVREWALVTLQYIGIDSPRGGDVSPAAMHYAPQIASLLQSSDPADSHMAYVTLSDFVEIKPINDLSVLLSVLNAACLEKDVKMKSNLWFLAYRSGELKSGSAAGRRDLILIRWLGNREPHARLSAKKLTHQHALEILAAFNSLSRYTKDFPALKKDIARQTARIKHYQTT